MNDKLDVALASARWWRDIGIDLVIGGIIAEVLIETFWPKNKERSKKIRMGLAGAVVAFGIWIETGESNKADDISDDIRHSQQSRIATQQEKIFSLETCLAARHMSLDKQYKLTAALNPFAGTAFDAAIGPRDDPEPLYLLRAIHSALVAAGWKAQAWTTGDTLLTEAPMPPIGETMVTNVIVDVGPTHWAKFGQAATALAKALADAGIDAIADTKPTSIDTDAIHIRIGRRLCFAEPPRE